MSWNVSDLMTRAVVVVDPAASFKTCVRTMRMHGVGALPVTSRGKVVGIISVTDLMLKEFRPSARERYAPRTVRAKDDGLTAARLMTPDPVTISANAPLAAAVRLMYEHRINRLPVVDAEKRLVGIISRSDVLRVFLRSDLSIKREVAQGLLEKLPFAGRGHIKPEVRDGVVTLEGDFENSMLTDLLPRLVASVPGVVGVRNRLTVDRARRL
ncbi:MAG TPA: CBS domain-containing protein [Candidatus Sulfotelmatobacter sp.]|nr:CBS domain-containing protein [Candidatus Sulfotelmatobacter sp.]